MFCHPRVLYPGKIYPVQNNQKMSSKIGELTFLFRKGRFFVSLYTPKHAPSGQHQEKTCHGVKLFI